MYCEKCYTNKFELNIFIAKYIYIAKLSFNDTLHVKMLISRQWNNHIIHLKSVRFYLLS